VLKLKVFAGENFQSCEDEFNYWMEHHLGIVIVNVSFNNGEKWREITLLWSEAPPESRVTVPQLHVVGKPQ
jgi:hypothetical protein